MPNECAGPKDGAALVEAAFVLPILLLLLFGVMEISLYFWSWSLATKATQLGVRRAVLTAPVAVGPGLEPSESEGYWDGLPPGASCSPNPSGVSLCPTFAVQCSVKQGCRCRGNACRFRLAAARLTPILQAMQAVMPDLKPDEVEVSYSTNNLGYVTRPPPVPVDVRVTLVGVHYTPLLLGDIFGSALPLRASAELPSEALASR